MINSENVHFPLQYTLVSPHSLTRSLQTVLTFRKIDGRRILRKSELGAHTVNQIRKPMCTAQL